MTNLEFFRILDGQKNGKIVSEIASNVREIMYSYLSIMNTSVLNAKTGLFFLRIMNMYAVHRNF